MPQWKTKIPCFIKFCSQNLKCKFGLKLVYLLLRKSKDLNSSQRISICTIQGFVWRHSAKRIWKAKVAPARTQVFQRQLYRAQHGNFSREFSTHIPGQRHIYFALELHAGKRRAGANQKSIHPARLVRNGSALWECRPCGFPAQQTHLAAARG